MKWSVSTKEKALAKLAEIQDGVMMIDEGDDIPDLSLSALFDPIRNTGFIRKLLEQGIISSEVYRDTLDKILSESGGKYILLVAEQQTVGVDIEIRKNLLNKLVWFYGCEYVFSDSDELDSKGLPKHTIEARLWEDESFEEEFFDLNNITA